MTQNSRPGDHDDALVERIRAADASAAKNPPLTADELLAELGIDNQQPKT